MIAAIARKSRVGMGSINKPSSNLVQTFERWPLQIKDVLFRSATFLFSLLVRALHRHRRGHGFESR